jgi:hypothetical protein
LPYPVPPTPASVITLTLLHPIQAIPVQSWTFDQESVIRIGRATDNHVILYSAVVSRHHVELRRCSPNTWEIVSLGANGTYLDGTQISQTAVLNGAVFRLARSGPNLQIHFDGTPVLGLNQADQQKHVASPLAPFAAGRSGINHGEASPQNRTLGRPAVPVAAQRSPQSSSQSSPQSSSQSLPPVAGIRQQVARHETLFDIKVPRDRAAPPAAAAHPCAHARARAGMLFCPDCGQPMQVVTTLGDYQVLKILRNDGPTQTQLVWRNGQNLWLHSLRPHLSAETITAFGQRAQALMALSHPNLPRPVECFTLDHQPYLVTEQMQGQSLQDRVQTDGPLAAHTVIPLALQICDVLTYLHHQPAPLIHQALTPDALFHQTRAADAFTITLGGLLNVLDNSHTDNSHTADLRAYPYLAPEQKLGRTIGPEADLFALGLILLYLVTGQPPTAFYDAAQVTVQIPSRPEIPPALRAILEKLTRPQCSHRYATARDVAADLLQVV